MKISFDQTTDYSYRELHRFLKKASAVPEYVKEFTDTTDYSGLPTEAFADQYNRAYPKNSKEATYLSYVHFLNKKAALTEKYNESYAAGVENKLRKSAELFEITKDLDAYKTDLEAKEAADYSTKVVYEADVNGAKLPLFAYRTAEELKYAADQFATEYRKIPFEWRKDICTSFVKHAGEQKLDELPDLICKYAGLFYAHPEQVKVELQRRGYNSKVAEHKDIYAKMSDTVDGLDDLNDFMKIAETCYWMERQEGVYDNKNRFEVYGDPVNQIFQMPIEKLAEELDVVKIGSDYFKMADLQGIKPDVYKQAFGIDLDVTDSDNLRDVLPTMPLADLSLLRELSGIKPV